MPDYSLEQQRTIRSVFERLENTDCRHVIPRGYRDLPEAVRGSDIEVLVHEADFVEAKQALEAEGFSSDPGRTSRYAKIAQLGIQNPASTLQTVASRPKYVASVLLSGDLDQNGDETESLRGQVRAPVFSADGVVFHLHNHLAYTSPMFDRKIRVDPVVERGMIERRRRQNNLFVPSPPDELLHLVCRGVFDYEGAFPDYYVEKCANLWNQVTATEEWDETFRKLLSDVFYAADELVYEHVASGEYDDLRDQLIAYTDY